MLAALLGGQLGIRADPGPNLLNGDFETGIPSYNPWGGVDYQGNIHVLMGEQFGVNDDGVISTWSMSPSIAVGDLNGDGLPDLVVADGRGFFWFFPNSGTPTTPVFTHGEIMPLWLSNDSRDGDIVPRIQLIDLQHNGKLDLVVGAYDGSLYLIKNTGSLTVPRFIMPNDPALLQIPTRSNNQLWCNYLAPFLYDWSGTGRLDLLMGEGTYSSNSIYLFSNQGDNNHPIFNEKAVSTIIPGMGREDLTPAVLDWNNDGKPDIISGEREGYLDVYLNQAASKNDPPVFDKDAPLHVKIGDSTILGNYTTVCAADLNHDKLFDLVLGKPDGHLVVAINSGAPGSPKFDALVPLKGENPYPRIISPRLWRVDKYTPFGAPYELLQCVNAQTEPDFVPPPDFNGKGAMKFSIFQPQNKYFIDNYLPSTQNDQYADLRSIEYLGGLVLTTDTRYTFGMDVKSTGNVSELAWTIYGIQTDPQSGAQFPIIIRGDNMSTGDNWTKISNRCAPIREPMIKMCRSSSD